MNALLRFEHNIETAMRVYGVATLQVTIGVSYVLFGITKLFTNEPFIAVLRIAMPQFPQETVVHIIGTWEILIGVGMLLPLFSLPRSVENWSVRIAFLLTAAQIVAIFVLAFVAPFAVFSPKVPQLSTLGDFLLRNFIAATAGMVIVGHLREHKEPEVIAGA